MSNSNNKATKHVRFATEPIIHQAVYEEQDPRVLWYDSEDTNRFCREVVLDSAKCARMISRKAALRNTDAEEGLSDNEIAQCVGLETLLSPNLHRRLRAMRRRHTQVILWQQTLQTVVDAGNVENLARLSRASSQEARQRSIILAQRYFRRTFT